jgi:putative redox protein
MQLRYARHPERKESPVKVRIKWVEGVSFLAQTESAHALLMDGAAEGGGRNLGPRPMEVVLAGTGGCTAYDVVTILRKARQPVTDCVVEIEGERAAQDPKVFTRIHFHFVVTGTGVDPRQVERAIELSAKKYCSASIMLGKTAEITHDFEIKEG